MKHFILTALLCAMHSFGCLFAQSEEKHPVAEDKDRVYLPSLGIDMLTGIAYGWGPPIMREYPAAISLTEEELTIRLLSVYY